jgi:hypothetical protein
MSEEQQKQQAVKMNKKTKEEERELKKQIKLKLAESKKMEKEAKKALKIAEKLEKIAQAAIVVFPALEHIVYFDITHPNSRSNNTETNEIRENVIHHLQEIPQSYFEDVTYGPQWLKLKQAFNNALHILQKDDIPIQQIEKMAGRKYNYDFKFHFADGSTQNIEFKYNCSSLKKLPQFIQLNIKHNINAISYAEYFYDNFLDEYISVDPSLPNPVDKLDKVKYLELITNTNHECHPFFQYLKTMLKTSTANYEKMCAISKRSIDSFLSKGHEIIDLQKLSYKFNESQSNKIFMMWDGEQFILDQFTAEQLLVTQYEGIVNKNSIIVSSATGSKYKLLLAWKNYQGILNPAWYISLV